MIFEERERAAERAFEQEQQHAFELKARRNKLFGLWAAHQMGRSGVAAERYAMTVVEAEVTAGDESILRKVLGDLLSSGHPASTAAVEDQLRRCTATARRQLQPPGAEP